MVLRNLLFGSLVAYASLLPAVHAEPAWFSFWARNPDNANPISNPPDGQPGTNEAFEAMLKMDAELGQVTTVQSKSVGADGSTWYWIAFIDPDKVNTKYSNLAVLQVIVDIDKSDPPPSQPPVRKRKRWGRYTKRAVIAQDDAPRQLKFLSLPSSANNDLDNIPSYRYDETAGAGVRIYVMDTGLNFDSSEWQSEKGRADPAIIFAGFANEQKRQDLDDEFGHGTCMADIALGKINGVAKEADLTSVQIDDRTSEFKMKAYFETNVEAIAKVADDIADKKLGDKAVLLMAFGILSSGNVARDNAFEDAYFNILETLDQRGVALVTAVPNKKGCDTWPCLWNDPDNPFRIEGLITVASGLVNDGSPTNPNVDSWVTIHAPGDDRRDGGVFEPGMICADNQGDRDSDVGQGGTSHAAAIVAGLMAYFKGLGLSNGNARSRLVNTAYSRKVGGPDMVYNGVV